MQRECVNPMENALAQRDRRRRFIRIREVCIKTSFSPATVWRKVKSDPDFPQPIKLSEGVTAWYDDEINDWADLQDLSEVRDESAISRRSSCMPARPKSERLS